MAEQDPLHAGSAEAPSITGLVEQLVRDLTALVRSEGRLAKAEFMETLHKTTRSVAMIIVAGLVCLLAGIVLVQALVVALAGLIGPGWASLVVGVGLAVIGLILFQTGMQRLKRATRFPERTLEQISRDGRLVQERL